MIKSCAEVLNEFKLPPNYYELSFWIVLMSQYFPSVGFLTIIAVKDFKPPSHDIWIPVFLESHNK